MEWLLGVVASVAVAFLTARFTAQNEHKRLREELKLEYSVENAIIQLLEKQGYPKRSFHRLKKHIRGFEDDELRQHLVRAGAIAFENKKYSKEQQPDRRERWGLLRNNLDDLRKAESDDPD